MHNEWSPQAFAATLARIRDAMRLSWQDIARMAGVSRSQASRWSRAEHQPAYANIRRAALAIYPDEPELAQQLMAAAGYSGLTEADRAAAPAAGLVPGDDWERAVLEDPDLPDYMKTELITASRDARARYAARRAERRAARESQPQAS